VVEHVLGIVLWAIAFFTLVYARLSQVPGELEGMATRLSRSCSTWVEPSRR
jgi:hypothetical protein